MISIFPTIINLTLIGSIIAIITIIFRLICKNKLPKVFLICLWCIVFIKFVLPINIPSPTSIFNSINPETATQIIQDTVIYTNAENNTSPLVIQTLVEETNNTVQSAIAMPTKLYLSDILGIIWLCGMLIMLLVLIFIYVHTIMRFKTPQLIKNNDQINNWIKDIKIKRKVKVYTSINVSTPLVFGILKPKILLPIDFDFTNESTLNHVLAHELQHIKQFDNLTNIFVLLILCIHWFNPIMWICYLLFQRDIETFCDERVLCSIGEECKSEYAKSLLNIAQNKQKLSPAFIFSFGETSVKERVKSIMKYRKATVLSVVTAIILLSSVLIVLATGGMKNAEYVYKGETEITIKDRYFKLEQLPKSKEEELYIKFCINEIKGDWDKQFNVVGEEELEPMNIEATKKNFLEGQYTKTIVIHSIKTLTKEECTIEDNNINYYVEFNMFKEKYDFSDMVVIRFEYTQIYSQPEHTQWGDGRIMRNIVLLLKSQNDNYKIYGFGMPFYTETNLQSGVEEYLARGGKKVFGMIEDFKMENGKPVAVRVKVMEFTHDSYDGENPNGFHIEDLKQTETYSFLDRTVTVAPLVAPNYNTTEIYREPLVILL